MMWNGYGGWGWGMGMGLHIVWWVLIAVGIAMLVRWAISERSDRRLERDLERDRQPDGAMAILRERYARGEIDKAEFEARKADLA